MTVLFVLLGIRHEVDAIKCGFASQEDEQKRVIINHVVLSLLYIVYIQYNAI